MGRRPSRWRASISICCAFAVVTFIGVGVDYGSTSCTAFKNVPMRRARGVRAAPVILVAAAITLLGYGTLLNSSYPPFAPSGSSRLSPSSRSRPHPCWCCRLPDGKARVNAVAIVPA
jgi:hypothetical protein